MGYEEDTPISIAFEDDLDLLSKQIRADAIAECIKKIEEFAECNEDCALHFYEGQGCKACVFGMIKALIKEQKNDQTESNP